MSGLFRRTSVASGRRWWEDTSRHEGSPIELDGYGVAGAAGGGVLLRAVADDIRRKLEISDHTSVLEVGAGAGAIAAGIAPYAGRFVAVDFSHGMLQHARRLGLPRMSLVTAEGAKLPFATASFDRVLCYFVFNNFPDDAYAGAVIHELMRVTRPGGTLLIGQVPNLRRKAEWYRAYHAKFGGAPQSRLRAWLGAARHRGAGVLNAFRAMLGQPPPPALLQRYYDPNLFEDAAVRAGNRCELLGAYDFLQAPGGTATYDLRLDVRIHVAS